MFFLYLSFFCFLFLFCSCFEKKLLLLLCLEGMMILIILSFLCSFFGSFSDMMMLCSFIFLIFMVLDSVFSICMLVSSCRSSSIFPGF